MENITKYLSTLLFLLFFLFSSLIFSEEIKKKITIVGNDNIDDEVIFSIIGDKLTDYSQDSLNQIIKTLYNTGNFQKIEIENLSNELIRQEILKMFSMQYPLNCFFNKKNKEKRDWLVNIEKKFLRENYELGLKKCLDKVNALID